MTEKSKEVLDKEGFRRALKRDFHIAKLAVNWLSLSHWILFLATFSGDLMRLR